MADRPIIFKGEMVRAILDGRKTQTRRVVKPQPVRAEGWPFLVFPKNEREADDRSGWVWPNAKAEILEQCRYGQAGDSLWVKEDFAAIGDEDKHVVHYLASHSGRGGGWKEAAEMPRWASRITLEITDVRVERLQEISEEDARAEGVFTDEMRPEERDFERNTHFCPKCAGTGLYDDIHPESLGVLPDQDCEECRTAKKRFQHLWESINGPESWEANPWVWVVTFRQIRSSSEGARHE